MSATHDRPCAAPGLTGFRCKTPYGWIMPVRFTPTDTSASVSVIGASALRLKEG